MFPADDDSPPPLCGIGLEPRYDLVVLGTSLTPSVVAAAASTAGKTVLHLDANQYYGGLDDATFTLDEAITWAERLEAGQPSGAFETDGDDTLLDALALKLARARAKEEAAAAAVAEEAGKTTTTTTTTTTTAVTADEEEESEVDAAKATASAALLRPRLRLQRLCANPVDAARLLSYTKEEVVVVAAEEPSAGGERTETPAAEAEAEAEAEAGSSPTTPGVESGEPSGAAMAEAGAEAGAGAGSEAEVEAEDLDQPRVSLGALRKKSRSFALDLSPHAVLCAGGAVELMVSSGAGRYLEFLSMEALCVLEEKPPQPPTAASRRAGRASSSSSSSSSSSRGKGRGSGGGSGGGVSLGGNGGGNRGTEGSEEEKEEAENHRMWRVPCSKRDIFSSKDLPRTEKLVLMKFLRFCLDWGKQHVRGQAVADQDDQGLTSTRALNRPQSLPASSAEGEAGGSGAGGRGGGGGGGGGGSSNEAKALAFLEATPEGAFTDFLSLWKLPLRLKEAVLYAIAMVPDDDENGGKKGGGEGSGKGGDGSGGAACVGLSARRKKATTAREGLEAVFSHLSSLGQYGETAFLAPLYGSAEVAQAFCRLCAVSCGTYVLRQAPHAVVVQDGDGSIGGEGGSAAAGAAAAGAAAVVGVCDHTGGLICCDGLVCDADYLRGTSGSASSSSSSSSSASSSSSSSSSSGPRHWTVRRICIIDRPVREDMGRFLVVFKPGTEGIGNQGAIYAMHLDDSTNIAPSGLDVCVVHLTMSFHYEPSDPSSSSGEEELKRALGAAGAALDLASVALRRSRRAAEVWHLSFAVPCGGAPGGSGTGEGGAEGGEGPLSGVGGAAACARLPYQLDPDGALRAARRLFGGLFPGERFLVRNEEELAEQARMRGEAEDADQEVLEAALWRHLTARAAALEAGKEEEARRLGEVGGLVGKWLPGGW